MIPGLVVDEVLRSVLGGRRKRSRRTMRYLTRSGGGLTNALLSNPQALLTAAGLAWGVFETMQGQGSGTTATGGPGIGTTPAAPPAPAAPLPPLPNVGGVPSAPAAATAGADADALRLVQIAVSAANADGTMSADERAGIIERARAAGVGDVVERELAAARPLAAIVAGVTDPAARATLYVLAYTTIRADEQVSGAERIYLAQLAHHLGLDPAAVQALEQRAAAAVDAQADGE